MILLNSFLCFWSLKTGCIVLSIFSAIAAIAAAVTLLLFLITENLSENARTYFIMMVVVILGIYLPANITLLYGAIKGRPFFMAVWLVVALFKMVSLLIDTFIRYVVFKQVNLFLNITLLVFAPFMMLVVYSHVSELLEYYAKEEALKPSRSERMRQNSIVSEPPEDILDAL